MSEELPGGEAPQTSTASQPAAQTAPAAPQPAPTLMDGDGQQQATQGKDPASADAGKPDDKSAKPAEDKGTKPEGNAPQGAPENYDFKSVEGAELSKGVIDTFSEVAKELNLSQEAAQKMLDQVAPAIVQHQHEMLQRLDEQWVNAVKADKEIGGEKLSDTLSNAVKARDAFGSNELRTLLKETRLGNHPEMLRFFAKVGKAISEDKFVAGGNQPPAGGRNAADVLYGKQS